MINWKNQQDIKKKLDEELSGMTAGEERLGEILNRIQMGEFEETGAYGIGGNSMRRGNKKRSIKTVFKVAIIAAAITVVSVGTVFGYEYFQRKYADVEPYYTPLESVQENAPVHEVEKPEADIIETDSNLVVNWDKYAVTEHGVIFTITVKSQDGTPIFSEEENKVPIVSTLRFDKVNITIDDVTESFKREDRIQGTIYSGCVQKGIDIAEDLSDATIQLEYSNSNVSLPGKEISLELDGFAVEYFTFEDMGVKDNLGNLLANGAEAEKSDFVSCGAEPVFFPGFGVENELFDLDTDYNLSSGDNKIYFSELYPECYIDNFGFIEGKYDGTKKFYMTVVCDEASKNDVKQMTFQSSITGWNEGDVVKELVDGRLQYMYTVNTDNAYSDITSGGRNAIDTTMEHLKTLYIKKNPQRIWEVAAGIWEKKIMLDDSANSISAGIDVFVPGTQKTDIGFTAKEIVIDSMKVKVSGTCGEDFDFQYFGLGGENAPIVVLKDGTRIQADKKGIDAKAWCNTITGEIEICGIYDTIINISDVASVEFHGVTIWKAE